MGREPQVHQGTEILRASTSVCRTEEKKERINVGSSSEWRRKEGRTGRGRTKR